MEETLAIIVMILIIMMLWNSREKKVVKKVPPVCDGKCDYEFGDCRECDRRLR